MTVWDRTRAMGAMGWSTKAVIAAGVLAVLLVAAVPVALLVALIMVLLGHIVGGFALFGASILAAVAGVAIAGLSGVQHVRKLVRQQSYRIVQLRRGEYNFD
jgi:uncharacterized membrane protein YdjX (TVP38/TMEM64 family)